MNMKLIHKDADGGFETIGYAFDPSENTIKTQLVASCKFKFVDPPDNTRVWCEMRVPASVNIPSFPDLVSVEKSNVMIRSSSGRYREDVLTALVDDLVGNGPLPNRDIVFDEKVELRSAVVGWMVDRSTLEGLNLNSSATGLQGVVYHMMERLGIA